MATNREILMRFLSEQNQKIQDDISQQGYKDNSPYRNNPFNVIQGSAHGGTPVTMDGVSTPLKVTDNFGKTRVLSPNSGNYYFEGDQVVETPIYQRAGTVKYVKSANDPRYKAYQDSLNTYNKQNQYNAAYISNFKNAQKPKDIPVSVWDAMKRAYSANNTKAEASKNAATTAQAIKDFQITTGEKNVRYHYPEIPEGKYKHINKMYLRNRDIYPGRYIPNSVANTKGISDLIAGQIWGSSPTAADDTKNSKQYYKTIKEKDNETVRSYKTSFNENAFGNRYTNYTFGYPHQNVINPRIKPIGNMKYYETMPTDRDHVHAKNSKELGFDPTSMYYDDSGFINVNLPYYKKPTQEYIIQNPQPQPDRTQIDVPQSRREQIQSPKGTPQGIVSNFNLEASQPIYREQYREPKYYNVRDVVNQPFGGSDTSYKWTPSSGEILKELSQEKYDDGTPYNTRTMTPVYKGGGSTTKNLTGKDRGTGKKAYPMVASKDFAGGGRSYPIPTKANAIDALRLAGLHHRPDVRAKVFAKYPELRHKKFGGDTTKLQDIIYGSFQVGGQLNQYQKAGIVLDERAKMFSKPQDNTYVVKPKFDLKKEILQEKQAAAQYRAAKQKAEYEKYGTIHAPSEQSTLSRVGDFALAPTTALKDLYQRGEVRPNLVKGIIQNPGEMNPYDLAYLGTGAAAGLGAAGIAASPYLAPVIAGATDIAGANLAGVAGLNLGNALGAGFATHGAMNIVPNIRNKNYFDASMNVLDMAPLVGPTAKILGEGYNTAKNMRFSASPEVLEGLQTQGFFNPIRNISKETDLSKNLNQITREVNPYHEDAYLKRHIDVPIEEKFVGTMKNKEINEVNKNKVLDILENWAYENPSQIRENKKIMEQVADITKERSAFGNNYFELSREAGIDSANKKLKIIDDYHKGIPQDETDGYIAHVLNELENNPNLAEELLATKEKNLDELNKYGDKYFADLSNSDFRSLSSEDLNKSHLDIKAYKDKLDSQIKAAKEQTKEVKINPEFESKIRNLFELAGEEAPANIIDPYTAKSIRDKTKVVYPKIGEADFQDLSTYQQKTIQEQFPKAYGFRGSDQTISFGNTPGYASKVEAVHDITQKKVPFKFSEPSTWLGKKTIPVTSNKPSKIIKTSEVIERTPEEVLHTLGHEGGHDLGRFGDWQTLIDEHSSTYGYNTTHGKNEISKLLKDNMISADENTWLSSGNELHADLMGERVNIISKLDPDPKKAIKIFRENEDFFNDMILKEGDLNKFFKPGTSKEVKKKILKILPVAIPAAIGVGAITKATSGQQPTTKMRYGGEYKASNAIELASLIYQQAQKYT